MIDCSLSHSKIVATLGPASQNEETLKAMFESGLNVCRLNFSHGTYSDHLKSITLIRALETKMNKSVAILADLQGPKLRIGEVEAGVVLENGSVFEFVSEKIVGTAKEAYMSYADFPSVVSPGENILIDDGKLRLEVVSTDKKSRVVCLVLNGGPLFSKKGVNLPNTPINLPSLTVKDREDAVFAMEHGVDWLGLSFVRKAEDVQMLKNLVKEHGLEGKVSVLAKIEKPEALVHFDDILQVADAIMVARGDLGVEVSFEQVPLIQKELICKSVAAAKPVVVATQMLESMIHNFVPTRAEANDVANAVLDGADAVMLSGETSVGDFPIESVQAMEKIIQYTEIKGFRFKPIHKPDSGNVNFIDDSLCLGAVKLANQSEAQAMVIYTDTEEPVKRIASYRPHMKMIVCTNNNMLAKTLSLVWGVEVWEIPIFERTAQAVTYTNSLLIDRQIVNVGDTILYVGHIPFQERKEFVNMVRVGTALSNNSGYPTFSARVIEGHRIGRTLGFPTANLDVDVASLGLSKGVYSADVRVEGDEKVHRAMVNIGMRPTFGENAYIIEVHIIEFNTDLYGKILEVTLRKKMREEKKFDSPELLKLQLAKDLKEAKRL